MAGTIYIRQSSFADGDTITAALFNNEFNQLANAFSYTTTGTTGHTHDGTDGQGGHISKIGDQDFKNKIVADSTNNRWGIFVEVAGTSTEQLRVVDGAIVPVLDSDINLGSPTAYFKDSYIDTVTTTGAVAVGGALSAASFAIGGTALTATITELNTLDGITATTAELNYTDGVTSNIQTQLNAKQPLDAQLTDIASLTPTDGTFIVGNGTNFVAENPATALASLGVTSTATELNILDGTTVTTTELNYVHNVTSPIQTQLNAKQALNAKLTDISNLTLADNFFLVSTGSNLALESPATALGSLGVTATATELNYVDGVTSSIQTQLNTKAPLASPTFTGTLTAPIINATSDLKINGETIGATVTEINYLSGVTSSIQTQLNALQASDTDLSAIAALTPSDGTFIVGNGTSWVAESGDTVIASLGVTATAAELNYVDGVTSSIQTQLDTKAPLVSPTFTGTVTADGLSLGDNDKAQFGDGNDLQIYHNGSHSIIADAGTGHLKLLAADLRINNAADTETFIAAYENSKVDLYYDNSVKLATTSTGIDVTGTATMDGLTVDGATIINSNSIALTGSSPVLTITDSDTNVDHTLSGASGVGNLTLSVDANNEGISPNYIINVGGNQTFRIADGGDISFYEDTGTTPKFFWDASDERLGLGTTSPSGRLHAFIGATNNNGIVVTSSNDALVTGNHFHAIASRGDTTAYNLLKLENSLGTKMIVQGNGNVGIGTTSPNTALQVSSAVTTKSVVETTGAASDALLEFTRGQGSGNTWSVGLDQSNASALSFAYLSNGSPSLTSHGKVTIDTSGNVGIGTTNPVRPLQIGDNTGNEVISIQSSSASTGSIYFGDNPTTSAEYAGVLRYSHTDDSMQFWTSSSEKMRIDSSGNLLVGKTASSLSTAGAELRSTGAITGTVSNSVAAAFNRLSTDGNILTLNKDGTTVGSIASTFGVDIHIGTGNTRLRFVDTNNYIRPANSDGSGRDAATDLGVSSARFKDLYLSGTANVANVKETVYALTGTALDAGNGGIQTKTLAANTTFTDSLASGESLVLQLEAGASYTVTWPTMQWVTSGGNVAPTLTAKDTLVFWKVSTTLYGAYTGSYV